MIKVKKEIQPRLLDIENAARFLGLAPKTLRNRLGPKAEKRFPVKCKRIGRKILFDLEDLESYVDGLPYG